MDKFERAIANMHNPASKAGLTSVVFVFGASGSGKTRIGLHVHESLRASTTTPMLVGYTAVEDWDTGAPAWKIASIDAAPGMPVYSVSAAQLSASCANGLARQQ